MLNSLIGSLFGCSHKRTTFPLTPGRNASASGTTRTGTYIACLDCGKEFAYDWKTMQVGDQVTSGPRPSPQPIIVRRPA
jgi:hypothetical protein